jgi:hypothetical protein
MEYGEHKNKTLTFYTERNLVSPFSHTVFFKIIKKDDSEKPQCDIKKGDLNCDGSVNLVDFSILLYYWGATSAKADVNNDGNVNLVDFSIMMFYWQG